MKYKMHVFDAIRYVTDNVGKKITHTSWGKYDYVYSTNSGYFIKHTPDGEFNFEWLLNLELRVGWEKYEK